MIINPGERTTAALPVTLFTPHITRLIHVERFSLELSFETITEPENYSDMTTTTPDHSAYYKNRDHHPPIHPSSLPSSPGRTARAKDDAWHLARKYVVRGRM